MRGTKEKIVYGALAAGEGAAFATVYWWIDAMGLLLGIAVATAAVLVFIRQEIDGGRIAYVNGYHAGYHAGADVECFGPDCAVLAMSHERMAEVIAIATSAVSTGPYPEARR